MAGRETGPRRLWLLRASLGFLLVACAVTIAVWRSPGTPPARAANLDDSSAWLPSTPAWAGVLVDGASAAVIRRVSLLGEPLAVAQSGPDAFAVLKDGAVQRIDGATFDLGAPVSFVDAGTRNADVGQLADGQPRLEIRATPSAVFVRDRLTGVVSIADPKTLRTVRTYSLAAPAGMAEGATISDASAGADGQARLWAVDGTGGLVRIDAAGTRVWRNVVSNPALVQLVTVADKPYLVDFAAGTVRTIGADGLGDEHACVEPLSDLRTVEVIGSSRGTALYLVNSQRGVLVVSDVAAGGCATAALPIAPEGHTLGQPKDAAGRVFIPDLSTGAIIVVDTTDPARPRVLARSEVVHGPSAALELVAQGTLMFYNDRNRDIAGVIRADGTASEAHEFDRGAAGVAANTPSGPAQTPPPAQTSPPAQPSQPAQTSAPARTPQPTRTAESRPVVPVVPVVPSSSPSTQASEPQPRTAPQVSNSPTAAPRTSARPPARSGVEIRVTAQQVTTDSAVTLRVVPLGDTAPVASASWYYGDGANGMGLDVTHSWAAAGTYTVSVSAQLVGGGTATEQVSITVRPRTAALPSSPPAQLPTGTQQPSSARPTAPGASPTSPTTTRSTTSPVRTTPPPAPTPTPSPSTAPPVRTTPPPSPSPSPSPTTVPPTTVPPTTVPPTTVPPTTVPPPTVPPAPSTYSETSNHGGHTWTNYQTAGGTRGPDIAYHQTVQVSCRVRGYVTPNGNDWWYRIASSPWNNAYYSDADGFYNNGQTSGPSNTVWVDTRVPLC
ncbi:hypothetical protein CcI49_12405 [Frankia sp. CcI49]|uniref:PKD domain-containing protein n=1 Tax=Frankia sp. CcI49 TaxID=1745382 RepID=UPI000978AA58|nr:PKD domain-containing protein [Frankia sp. CcI49]ONH60189.1 hypothetical protein CcI49_12405 [Frankia sp. CcI49]